VLGDAPAGIRSCRSMLALNFLPVTKAFLVLCVPYKLCTNSTGTRHVSFRFAPNFSSTPFLPPGESVFTTPDNVLFGPDPAVLKKVLFKYSPPPRPCSPLGTGLAHGLCRIRIPSQRHQLFVPFTTTRRWRPFQLWWCAPSYLVILLALVPFVLWLDLPFETFPPPPSFSLHPFFFSRLLQKTFLAYLVIPKACPPFRHLRGTRLRPPPVPPHSRFFPPPPHVAFHASIINSTPRTS